MDGNPNTLFFTDGINGETDGLFGSRLCENVGWVRILMD
jgi:hypothetical protein